MVGVGELLLSPPLACVRCSLLSVSIQRSDSSILPTTCDLTSSNLEYTLFMCSPSSSLRPTIVWWYFFIKHSHYSYNGPLTPVPHVLVVVGGTRTSLV
ncbi:hypothetical protein D9619_004480 [Psilocybe cf. subviscida]|uniref:Uncharacterized protein n=1 Tax=Psilocybe cf. subviscida TaxID=2480587 RepID=A0A8H5F879_9AGAR|nr:hypothetical protein D9619_004480 [Psilocybe cf. subviscida]